MIIWIGLSPFSVKNYWKFTLKAAGKQSSEPYLEITPDWKEYSFRFRAVKGGRGIITLSMWHNTRYGKMFYSAGDYFLLDNMIIAKTN